MGIAVTACASPAARFADTAAALGFRHDVVDGAPFQHVVFSRIGRPAPTLHVYLDGDGTPWDLRGPASDPTPRNPLVLRLMSLDPRPSVYLGRPCYHGLAKDPPCASAVWTADRYSESVVSSMTVALRRVMESSGLTNVAWFGYSGGGALAMILAPRFPETVALTTIAADLDIDAWADRHHYARLTGSLNPAAQPPLPREIRQRHYVGGRDRVVPQDITARAPIAPASLIAMPTFDHACCWESIWPAVLSELERTSAASER